MDFQLHRPARYSALPRPARRARPAAAWHTPLSQHTIDAVVVPSNLWVATDGGRARLVELGPAGRAGGRAVRQRCRCGPRRCWTGPERRFCRRRGWRWRWSCRHRCGSSLNVIEKQLTPSTMPAPRVPPPHSEIQTDTCFSNPPPRPVGGAAVRTNWIFVVPAGPRNSPHDFSWARKNRLHMNFVTLTLDELVRGLRQANACVGLGSVHNGGRCVTGCGVCGPCLPFMWGLLWGPRLENSLTRHARRSSPFRYGRGRRRPLVNMRRIGSFV